MLLEWHLERQNFFLAKAKKKERAKGGITRQTVYRKLSAKEKSTKRERRPNNEEETHELE